MEEILASIRRIIADDDAAKTPPTAPARAAEAAMPAPPVAPAPTSNARPAEPPAVAAREQRNVGSAPHEQTDEGDAAEDVEGGDILDLTESMQTPPPNVVGFRTVEAQSDVVFDSPAEAPEPSRSPSHATNGRTDEPHEDFAGGTDEDRLMSSRTTAAVDSAFNALAHTVLVQNSRTLDDVVREMLRPMLKTWLDNNLPSMVERMVRAEIERVSRGR